MNHISEEQKSNRAMLWIGALLVVLWVMTVATWMYDTAGYTVGMPMPLFFVHLAAPLVVGLIVGRRKTGLWSGAKTGAIAGALFGAANIAVQLLWGGVLYLLGRIPPDQPFTFVESLFEVLEFLVLFTLMGLILGMAGGFLGAAIGSRSRGR